LVSFSLTAGDWDVSENICFKANGATVTLIYAGIGTTSGNVDPGCLVNGGGTANCAQEGFPPTAATNSCLSIPAYRMSLSGTTTVYAKYLSSYSLATAQATGGFTARRIR
jgi:hypothetical protein